MIPFDLRKSTHVNFWITAAFAVTAVLGCEAAAPWRDETLHVHSAEAGIEVMSNESPAVTGAFIGS